MFCGICYFIMWVVGYKPFGEGNLIQAAGLHTVLQGEAAAHLHGAGDRQFLGNIQVGFTIKGKLIFT